MKSKIKRQLFESLREINVVGSLISTGGAEQFVDLVNDNLGHVLDGPEADFIGGAEQFVDLVIENLGPIFEGPEAESLIIRMFPVIGEIVQSSQKLPKTMVQKDLAAMGTMVDRLEKISQGYQGSNFKNNFRKMFNELLTEYDNVISTLGSHVFDPEFGSEAVFRDKIYHLNFILEDILSTVSPYGIPEFSPHTFEDEAKHEYVATSKKIVVNLLNGLGIKISHKVVRDILNDNLKKRTKKMRANPGAQIRIRTWH